MRNAWRSSDALPTISVANSLASHPEIPAGYDLADFQDRQRHLEMITGASGNPRKTWLSPLGTAAFGVIEVGTQRLSVGEARTEILGRAMDYLETAEKFCARFLFCAVIIASPPSPLFNPL